MEFYNEKNKPRKLSRVFRKPFYLGGLVLGKDYIDGDVWYTSENVYPVAVEKTPELRLSRLFPAGKGQFKITMDNGMKMLLSRDTANSSEQLLPPVNNGKLSVQEVLSDGYIVGCDALYTAIGTKDSLYIVLSGENNNFSFEYIPPPFEDNNEVQFQGFSAVQFMGFETVQAQEPKFEQGKSRGPKEQNRTYKGQVEFYPGNKNQYGFDSWRTQDLRDRVELRGENITTSYVSVRNERNSTFIRIDINYGSNEPDRFEARIKNNGPATVSFSEDGIDIVQVLKSRSNQVEIFGHSTGTAEIEVWDTKKSRIISNSMDRLVVQVFPEHTLPTLTVYYVNGSHNRAPTKKNIEDEINNIIKQAVCKIKVEERRINLPGKLEFYSLMESTRGEYWDEKRPAIFVLPTDRVYYSFIASIDGKLGEKATIGQALENFAAVSQENFVKDGVLVSTHIIIHEALHLESIAELLDVSFESYTKNNKDNIMYNIYGDRINNRSDTKLRYFQIKTLNRSLLSGDTFQEQWENLHVRGRPE
jgi:hypothetical protein